MKIYLIRHAESVGNINGSLTSTTDFELTDRGKEQAVRLGKRIAEEIRGSYTIAYCSPLLRAKQTLEGILSCVDQVNISVNTDEDLKEMDLGELECIPFSELKIKYPDVDISHKLSKLDAPNGESYQELKFRLHRFWKICCDKMKELQAENVLIVSHGITLRALTTYLLDHPDDDVNHLNWMENTSHHLLVFDTETETMHLERLNDYSHLKELSMAGYEKWGLFADESRFFNT